MSTSVLLSLLFANPFQSITFPLKTAPGVHKLKIEVINTWFHIQIKIKVAPGGQKDPIRHYFTLKLIKKSIIKREKTHIGPIWARN